MSTIENISPAVLKNVVKELQEMVQDAPEGIKVLINEEDLTDIQALIQGPDGTPYEGGAFRVKLQLSADYPNSPPKGYFLTKVFHPNVSKAGEICVNTLKKDWKKDLGLKHLLLTIKCLLIVPNAESALNDEAGKLILENYEEYVSMAKMMTSLHAASNEFAKAPAAATEGTATGADRIVAKKVSATGAVPDAKKRNLRRL